MNRPFFALWILLATLIGALIVVGPARSQTSAEIRGQTDFPCFGSCPAPSYGFTNDIFASQPSSETIPLVPFYLASTDDVYAGQSSNASEYSDESATEESVAEEEVSWDSWLEEKAPNAIVQNDVKDAQLDYDDYSYEDYDYEYDYDYAYENGYSEENPNEFEASSRQNALDGAGRFNDNESGNALHRIAQAADSEYDFLSKHDAGHDSAVFGEPVNSPEAGERLGRGSTYGDSAASVEGEYESSREDYEDEYSGYGAYDYEAELYGFDQQSDPTRPEITAETENEASSAYDELYGEDWSIKDEQYEFDRRDQSFPEEDRANDEIAWVEASAEGEAKNIAGFPMLQAILPEEESSPITSKLKNLGARASDTASSLFDQVDGKELVAWLQGTHQSTLTEQSQGPQKIAAREVARSKPLSLDNPKSWDGCDAWFQGLEKSRVAQREKSVLANVSAVSNENRAEQNDRVIRRRTLLSLAESMDRLGELLKSASYSVEDLAWGGMPDFEQGNIASREKPADASHESR